MPDHAGALGSPQDARTVPAARVERPAAGFRARRLARFVAQVDEVLRAAGRCRIIDLGGTTDYWAALEPVWRGRPIEVVLVNLQAAGEASHPFTFVEGDVRSLPQFADGSFDIVHSNSVIEHVGRWADMRAMAAEVRRLAPRHFVQTPYFWFPVEPHFRAPVFNWLPEPMRLASVLARRHGTFPRAQSIDEAVKFIEDSTLLDLRRFRALFPDAQIVRERVMGLTKSLLAVR